MEFKVGDKVKHINCNCSLCEEIGTVSSLLGEAGKAIIVSFIKSNGEERCLTFGKDFYKTLEKVNTNKQLELDF